MNNAEIQFLLHRIFEKSLQFYFQDQIYELRHANNKLNYDADLLYYNTINEEKYGNWIREEDMIDLMIELDLWNTNVEKQMKVFDKTIEDKKMLLYETFIINKNNKMIVKLRNNIRNMENQINSLYAKKQEFKTHTLEGYAEGIKQEHIIVNSLYLNNKKVFNNETHKSPQSYNKFNQLVSEINKYHINNNQYRDIAKSDIWRSYWNADKQNVFSAPVCEWSEEQRNLVNTSKMYDSVYEHPESPNEDIINDHDLLDGWMIKQKRENARKKKQSDLDNQNNRLKGAGEVYVMADNNKEELEEIYNMNSPAAKHVYKSNMQQLSEEGSVSVEDLRTTKTVLIPEQKSALNVRKNF
tara:strand:+ start:1772 stop:2833 length:1062 start_codon:yes stop_codon:yes gene_type:complete